jgi:hypothetical protein
MIVSQVYPPGMRTIGIFLLFAFLPVSPSVPAQTPPASNLSAPAAETITLGNSAATLPGPWKFAPGDSPWQNGAPLWAQPGFDDASWASMDLAPKVGSIDAEYGTPGFVPGWTARGYPNLYGYAWYRLRVHVVDPGQPLELKMPNDFDDIYQVYAGGRYVGQIGRFSPGHLTTYASRSFSFPLPSPGPRGEIELALRFYMTGGTRFSTLDAGGMHQPPVFGLASTVGLLQQADDDANLHYSFGSILQSLLFLLVLPGLGRKPSGAHLSLALSRAGMRSPEICHGLGREPRLSSAPRPQYPRAGRYSRPIGVASVDNVLVALVRTAGQALDSPCRLVLYGGGDARRPLRPVAVERSQPGAPLVAALACYYIRRVSRRIGPAVARHSRGRLPPRPHRGPAGRAPLVTDRVR